MDCIPVAYPLTLRNGSAERIHGEPLSTLWLACFGPMPLATRTNLAQTVEFIPPQQRRNAAATVVDSSWLACQG
jgi:hypothetical protein